MRARSLKRFPTPCGHSRKRPCGRRIGKPRLRPLNKRAFRIRPSRVLVVIAMVFNEVDLKRIEQPSVSSVANAARYSSKTNCASCMW